jgi:4-amino-4-deoxy-L-arabinose transferase-like glycosyltransferase
VAAALMALAWITACAVLDATYVRHGWSAAWYTQHEDRRTLVDRTTEHRVVFPNVHRPLARYLQGWPFERIPLPRDLPLLDATLRAKVEVPPGPPRYFAADARGEARLFIDGAPAEGRTIPPGVHALRVEWRGRPAPHVRGRSDPRSVHLEVRWGTDVNPVDPIPADALTPALGAWSSGRVALWWIAILGAIVWALLAFVAVRRGRATILATALIACLCLGLRLFDYDVMPEFRENADELFATWNGWSLLEDGTTRGWSLWPGEYAGRLEMENVRFFGEERTVISPYFEHPPLLHLFVGAAAHVGGADHWLEAKLAHTRLVPIFLSVITSLMLIAVARRLYPRSPAPWLGALVHAVLPTIALQERVIKEEAILGPLVLGMIFFFLRWRDGGRQWRDLVFAAVLAGLAPIAKVPAVVWVPALTMLIAAEKEHRKAALAMAIGFAVASLLLVFGAVIDWDVFLFTTKQQGTRPTHWNLFPRFFDVTLINHNLIGRGWILFLWISFGATALARGVRATAPLTVPLGCYLVAMAIGSGNWTFGWYMVPLYPFLCIGAGAFLASLWEKPTLLGGVVTMTLLVMYGANFTLDIDEAKTAARWPDIRAMVTLATFGALTPFGLAQVWKDNTFIVKLARATTVLGLIALVLLCAFFVITYDVRFDSYYDFDRDTYFHR